MEQSLLEKLYFGGYVADDLMDSSAPEQKAAYQRYSKEYTQVINRLGTEMAAAVQNLLDLHGDLTVEENARAYAAGVRFGVRLMNEALNRR